MDSAISKVKFAGWINPPKYWEPWVQKLCPDHQSTWKDAGIYEAVMSSTYAIKFHDGLILELVSRWCSQTNTFVFPWGEATLTLQDMFVLGGFSSLGISPLSSLENDVESLKIEEQLELAAKEIRTSTKTKIAQQTKWMEKFIGSRSELEHAGFLSLWLSRFVNPCGSSFGNIMNRQVFPIAARLSRGIEIALAPAVLAMLYGELTALNKRLHSMQLENKERPIELCGPFHLVQTWAWERFPILKPVPDHMCSCKDFPRLARWSNVKISNDKNIKSSIDSSKRAFLWCPYGAFGNLQGRDLESFMQWTETSELVGFDCCIETYQPQRVTRQFMLDGDIPASSVSFQPTVAACFEKWRRQKRCSMNSQVKVENMVDCDPPPGFPPRIKPPSVSVGNSDSDKDCSVMITEHSKLPVSTTVAVCFEKWRKRKICSTISQDKVENMVDCDPFPHIEVPSVMITEHSKLPVSTTVAVCFEKWRKRKICSTSSQDKVENMVDCDPFPHIEVPSVGNSDSDKDCSVTMIEHPKLPVSKMVSTRAFSSSAALSDSDVAIEVKDMRAMNKIEVPERASIEGVACRSTGSLGANSSFPQNELSTSCGAESHTNEASKDPDLDLEARISRLEKTVYAHIKVVETAR